MRSRTLAVSLTLVAVLAAAASAESLSQKVDPWVLRTAETGDTEFLVMLRDQADLRGAHRLAGKVEKGAFVMDALRSSADRAQAPLRALLAERGIAHRPFWVANMIWVRGDRRLVEELAAREDVFHIYANPKVRMDGPVSQRPAEPVSPDAIEWGVMKIQAPEVWALGFHGEGIVIGGQDTGYDWEHPAIKPKYRGWNGTFGDHNYNWHDSVHSGGGSCGSDSIEPCDDHSHGTHTMGTMVGDDGAGNQIGVAPGAEWIGCRNMDQGAGTPATYAECFEWFIAPTQISGANPNPAKAPHVINNSWGCPPSEGCTDPAVLQTVVENTRAAGIEVVVSAGNEGSSCSTVSTPAAIYDASFSIGATDSGDAIAGFSSRGPVIVDGSNRLKPDVSAPGVDVRSSVPGGAYASFSGTSMAGPHVAGLVALLLSASPALVGEPDAIEPLITGSAVPRTTAQTCGEIAGSEVPNHTYGWGRVSALAAIAATGADVSVTQTDAPDPAAPGADVIYSVTVNNAGPAAASDVHLDDVFTLSVALVSATPSQGSCVLLAHSASCDLGAVASGGEATVTVVTTPSVVGTVTATASVSSPELDAVPANNESQVTTTVQACSPVTPTLTAPESVAPDTAGLSASTSSPADHTVTWTLTGGTITAGQGTSEVTFTSGGPGTTMQIEAVDSIAGCDAPAVGAPISVDFLDVPAGHLFRDDVNTVARNGITAGCGSGLYCPDATITRAQMAVFLLKAKYGPLHVPPPATGTVFADVPQGSFAADWIEELASLGVTGGCGGGNFCPGGIVTRAQMAVFLLKAFEDAGYEPPPATGTLFDDVAADAFAADWIEELADRGVTAGCGGDNYCPDLANTRGQMAVFLVRTFGLE